MNYYVVLGIPTDADDLAIRNAFRSQVRRYHPDAGEGSSSERFRLLVEAYQTLSDPIRRQAYDQSLCPTPRPTPIPVVSMAAPIDPLMVRHGYASSYATPAPIWNARHFDELFDELCRAMEHDFFSRHFRGW
jgi:curved DNA-binding protein CbpA